MVDPADCVHDETLRPGQYRHLASHSWSSAGVHTHLRGWEVLRESLSEQWVPADPAREWVLRVRFTGRRRWLRGSYRSALAHGFGESFCDEPPLERRARFGDYGAIEEGREPQPGLGWPECWQIPTADFLAALPRDPRLLLGRLRSDSPNHPRSLARRLGRFPGYVGPWVYAVDALRRGIVPADLRAALYRAMRLIPGVRVVEGAINLDGAAALALVLDRSPLREEIFVDPDTGHYIGERRTIVAWNPVFPMRPGTVIGDAALHTTIVDDTNAVGRVA